MTIRIGCLGTGGVAQRHLRVANELDDVKVTSILGRTKANAETLAAAYDASTHDSVEELCNSGIDALLICTPPSAHQDAEVIAAERGLPFLVEKPLAPTFGEAARVADAVRQSGVITSVGYQWRYHSTVAAVQTWLKDRNVALVEGWWLTTTPPVAWWEQRSQSGGQVVEQLTHLVDSARFLVGEALAIAAVGQHVERNDHPNSDIEEVSSLLLRFDSGAIGSFTSACLLPRPGFDVGLRFVGDGFAIRLEASRATLETLTATEVAEDDGHTFHRLLEGFFDAIRTGDRTSIRSTYDDAMLTHRITTEAAQLIVNDKP